MRLDSSSCVWLIVFWLGAGSIPAGAVTLGFGCISNNSAADCAAGEAQVTVDVADAGGNQISFTFENAGPVASSITDVYWDDGGVLAGIFSITNTPGLVAFSSPADPGNLPAANDAPPPFQTTPGFSADSDSPVQANGVNPGEQLVVIFDLLSGKTFADAIADLTDGDLRIGVHVQGFASEGGESFVNEPIPEPGTAMLLGLGLLVLGKTRRSDLS